MIGFNNLFGITLKSLIFFMLNGVRYQCREEVILNILAMRSTAKDDKEAITITIAVEEE
jgi:hypothetical protein